MIYYSDNADYDVFICSIHTIIMKKQIFTSAYLAPISYYRALLACEEPCLEQYNNYERKTYQNRCEILSANGTIALTVPVEKSKQAKTPFKDIRIAHHTPWQQQHVKAIMSAYRNSPFYEYYIDEIQPLYEKNFTFMLDFNNELQAVILDQWDLNVPLKLTLEYYQGLDMEDMRATFHPKTKVDDETKPYIQVFADKVDFVPDLSILDLLFNVGPEAELFLK